MYAHARVRGHTDTLTRFIFLAYQSFARPRRSLFVCSVGRGGDEGRGDKKDNQAENINAELF